MCILCGSIKQTGSDAAPLPQINPRARTLKFYTQ